MVEEEPRSLVSLPQDEEENDSTESFSGSEKGAEVMETGGPESAGEEDQNTGEPMDLS